MTENNNQSAKDWPQPLKQCKTCPWRVGVDPFDIPGYKPDLHRQLAKRCIAPQVVDPFNPIQKTEIMACHYSSDTNKYPCAGWLHNQIGKGNNIYLRVQILTTPEFGNYTIDGEQHQLIEDTYPHEE